ncbi:hypothetical protein ABZ777_25545 [Micromonospora parva]|uniref:hypothetical protein n=1 Tax=Micromonospora parva TaxID=1464048 RepID=UPI0033F7E76E
MLAAAYGAQLAPASILPVAVARPHDLAAFTEARAGQGQETVRGHVELYRRDAAWITGHADELCQESG